MFGVLPSAQVERDDELEKLQRQAEALRFKTSMQVAARTGLALPVAGKAGNISMAALMGATKMAKRCAPCWPCWCCSLYN